MEYQNVYVAVSDILGFKDLIMNNDFETTKSIFENFVINLELSSSNGQAIQYEIHNQQFIGANPQEIRLNFNLFSDTVLIWTKDDSYKSFFDLLKCTATLFKTSMKLGLPLRGAITHGELIVNPFRIESELNNFENIVFGKSLIKGYELEQE